MFSNLDQQFDIVSPTRQVYYTVGDALKKFLERATIKYWHVDLTKIASGPVGDKDFILHIEGQTGESHWTNSIVVFIEADIPAHISGSGCWTLGALASQPIPRRFDVLPSSFAVKLTVVLNGNPQSMSFPWANFLGEPDRRYHPFESMVCQVARRAIMDSYLNKLATRIPEED